MKVGIYLGKNAAAAVLMQQRRKKSVVLAEARESVPGAFWDGEPKAIKSVFTALAGQLGSAARRADVPTNIAIPESHIREERLQFADVPTNSAELSKLLEWRVSRDYQLEHGAFALTHQKGRQIEGETELVARMGPKSLLDQIAAAARKTGFAISRVEGLGAFISHEAPDAGILSVRMWQTDCEVISQFSHAEYAVPVVQTGALGEENGSVAKAAARMAEANRIVTGANSIKLNISADPNLTDAARSSFPQDVELQHQERLGVTELARMAASAGTFRTTSFAKPVSTRPRVFAGVLSLIGIVGIGMAFIGVERAGDLRANAAKLDEHIASARDGEDIESRAPDVAQISEVASRVVFYNGLIGERHQEVGAILGALERALPSETWLRRLTYDVTTGAVALQIASEDEANLAGALAKIEATNALTSVILDRQIQVRSGQRVLSQYDISGVAR